MKQIVVKEQKKTGFWKKFFCVVALILLFCLGGFLGLMYNSDFFNSKKLTAQECDAVAQEIIDITTAGATQDNVDKLRQLNESYSNGCAGRLIIINNDDIKKQKNSCEITEDILLQKLFPEDSPNFVAHVYNSMIYNKLSYAGCPEKSEYYVGLAQQEQMNAKLLQPGYDEQKVQYVLKVFIESDMHKDTQQFLNTLQSSDILEK